MTDATKSPSQPLRIFYLEDNPLIVFHVEQMIEDLGHVFVGATDTFAAFKQQFAELEVDAVLLDIDLADGATGPLAAAWLSERGIPTLFVTGQEEVALQYRNLSAGIVRKPVSPSDMAEKLGRLTCSS
jgi:DNA-binding response OmpR family regulator